MSDDLLARLESRAAMWQAWIDDGEFAEFGYSVENMRHHQSLDREAAAALREARREADAHEQARGQIHEDWVREVDKRVYAEAERDRANALLAECQPWADIASGELGRRIDAHLRGEGEGR